MLPLRISLQGFMSYRDATTFDFEGARLWMLAGENGAGKSTVFDALRWVLFGVHRGGKQKPEQLIHHESQKLTVEVELRLGEELYKLRRTLGRDTVRPTWDVSRRVGVAWESVAGTSMAREYDKWVEEHIGLTDEAFCASVYLSQGRADAILNADADARYELLSQLVDLGVYERWHERAEDRRADARGELQDVRKRWETAPAPDSERLTHLRERSVQLGIEKEALEAKTHELESARTDATRWEEWNTQLVALETEAATYRALLEDEATIERDFARLQHLVQKRPTIDALWQNLNRRYELSREVEFLVPEQVAAQDLVEEAQQSASEAYSHQETAERVWTQANETWGEHLRIVSQLAPQRAVIERRGQLLEQRSKTQERDADFEVDLDAQLEQARLEAKSAREAARALPLWRRFVQAQRTYVATHAHKATLEEQYAQAITHRDVADSDVRQARLSKAEEDENLRKAVATLGGVNERAQALEQRRADFAQVEGEALCHFCGQELSPQHRAAELERLQVAAESLQHEQQQSQSAYENAQATFRQAEKAIANGEQALTKIEHIIAAADAELRHQSSNMESERGRALEAWDELGLDARRDLGFADTSFDDVFGHNTTHPSDDDLKRQKVASGQVGALEASVSRWEMRQRERDAVNAELMRLHTELAPVLNQWSDTAVEAWHTSAQHAESELTTAKRELGGSRLRLDIAREQQNNASQLLAQARMSLEDLTRRLGPLQGELKAVEGTLQASLPSWNAAMGGMETRLPELEEARALRDGWERETSELQSRDTNGRHQAISEARAKLTDALHAHSIYIQQIDSLPMVARRPRVAVEDEWQDSRAHLQQIETERTQIGDDVRRLEREGLERAALEAELHKRTQQFENWEELARLLGPHQLQRHLLRQAESAIVREANGVLEAISGGTLQLELVPDSDESSGNRRPKVLDVMCYHLSGNEESKAIAPAFLSGSQRFRVAVALALGIGRTAARGSNGRAARVETILIDEGFGSLDKVGRDEMKDELRELGRELGRVILVSHQEDFARAFPNRFNISMQNGVSRMQKVVE